MIFILCSQSQHGLYLRSGLPLDQCRQGLRRESHGSELFGGHSSSNSLVNHSELLGGI